MSEREEVMPGAASDAPVEVAAELSATPETAVDRPEPEPTLPTTEAVAMAQNDPDPNDALAAQADQAAPADDRAEPAMDGGQALLTVDEDGAAAMRAPESAADDSAEAETDAETAPETVQNPVATQATQPETAATAGEASGEPTADLAEMQAEMQETQLATDDAGTAEANDEITAEAVAMPESSLPTGASAERDVNPDGSNVRMLSVGQPVQGTVKRVSDFGAFVDIGVGRDGLVHISELSVKRVGKVGDVLTQGQKATFWIKKLDRDRNRISLTMIEPGTKTMRDLEKDDVVQGTVTRMMPYGAFVDLGVGRDALLHVREMGERFIARPEDVVSVGEVIEARIIEISRRRSRIDLSLKGLRPEPEPEPQPEPVFQPETSTETEQGEAEPRNVAQRGSSQRDYSQREPSQRDAGQRDAGQREPGQRAAGQRESAPREPEVEDKFADIEVLSPIELALKRAMEASGKTVDYNQGKNSKKNSSSRNRARAMQEEALARTLGGRNR